MTKRRTGGEIIFLGRTGNNIGDNFCSPYLYFRQHFPRSRYLEIHLGNWETRRLRNKLLLSPILMRSRLLIVGGGGFIGLYFFKEDLKYWSSAPFCPKILWGPGHNTTNILAVDSENPSMSDYGQLKRFDKVGIRDWGVGYNWVPCSSCMNPEFSKPVSENAGIVAALHGDTRTSATFIDALVGPAKDPVDIIFNDGSPEPYFDKLRNAKAVVTNSYHAAYWATLFGKRVAVVGGGSKVRMLKHRPALASVDDWIQRLEEAECYPHALEECRDRNLEYCNEIVSTYL